LNYIFTRKSLHDILSVARIMRDSQNRFRLENLSGSIFEIMLWEIASIILKTKASSPSRSTDGYNGTARKEFNQIIIPDLLRHDVVYSEILEKMPLRPKERYMRDDLLWLVRCAEAAGKARVENEKSLLLHG